MFCLLLVEYVAFPDRKDAILEKAAKTIPVSQLTESSGNIGLFYSGKCHETFPNNTLNAEKKDDWCSNIGEPVDGKRPWIQYRINGKGMKIIGYSIRNGCCWYSCCCYGDQIIDYDCCCRLYSFSLQGSNDNMTWKVIHKVEKDKSFWDCKTNTYTLDKETESFNFVRIVLDESLPGCPFCMQINQFEVYGETVDSFYSHEQEQEENDESVSIIGKVKREND